MQKDVKESDIFDRIMRLPIVNVLEPFYKKHKVVLLYLFFGVLSFLISIGTYALTTEIIHINILIANIFAWVFSVSFAYITNRIWVFKENATELISILAEIGKFASARLATLGVEELILYVFVSKIGFENMAVKIVATVIVIILNYLISKLWVFQK